MMKELEDEISSLEMCKEEKIKKLEDHKVEIAWKSKEHKIQKRQSDEARIMCAAFKHMLRMRKGINHTARLEILEETTEV